MHPRAFPPEIWSQVFQHLPKSHQKNLLAISRVFHDVAIPFVFSSIKIYFMSGGAGRPIVDTSDPSFYEATCERLMRRSWEILHYIARQPNFARVVKSVTVIAFTDSSSIFEQLCLEEGIRALTNLRTFRWIGTSPRFPEHFMDSISQGLHILVVQSALPLINIHEHNELTHLHFPIPFYYPKNVTLDSIAVDEALWTYSEAVNVSTIVEDAAEALQSLMIISTRIAVVPMRVYNTLTELEICVVDEAHLPELDLVFRHAIVLESLTLVGFIPHSAAAFSVLPSDAPSLPYLRSFRLSCERDFTDTFEDYPRFLCEFLQAHPILRQLHLRVAEADDTFLAAILPVIGGLQELEVLGLHTGRTYFSENEIMLLTDNLPYRLKALHLAIIWEHSQTNLVSLVNALVPLPQLSFLQLYGIDVPFPPLAEDLATDLKHLKLVGLNRHLWDVDWVGSEVILTRWPKWKAKFCTEDDFDSADDAWLYKFH
ncbi:hypothetical protein BDQ12DRAFT_673828 [Crucibulum laeve]|uniref:F-box domain-containing protein n=1 Tax=Crucibulum laeve TaxID=68775 RepID=A0A5C3MLX3_9AGAR|nr:hypothetical protein BDQ12DRAFT_673828 [Crucibulum laeve]